MKFERLNNTRDLAEAAGACRIRPGRLLRSGHLFDASPADLQRLSGTVSRIVDFRTKEECAEKPDPALPGVRYLHLPIFEDLAAGITRDGASDQSAFEIAAGNPEVAKQYMIGVYAGFVTNAFCVSQYRRFLALLLEGQEKAILFHCTAGKDRTGFAAALIQTLLGMTKEEIFADYLETNRFLHEETQQLVEMVATQMGGRSERLETDLDWMFGAHEEYLAAAFQSAETAYGSLDGFLTEALGIGPAERTRMKELYLEP